MSWHYPIRFVIWGAAALCVWALPAQAQAPAGDPLPSWNDTRPKQAVVEFLRATTERGSADFVPPQDRVAAFDQDGTLWVSHPMYTQVVYCFERLPAAVAKHPELKDQEPYRTVLSRDRAAIAKLPMNELEKVLALTLSGMDVDAFQADVQQWLAEAKHPRWKRKYTELTYQPMLEVMQLLRANGYQVYIVTGGGQDFVRAFAEPVYGVGPERVVGTMGGVKYEYDTEGRPQLIKEPKLLLNDNFAGKPEGMHLMIGRRPRIAFGNSTGDRQMLEYTATGSGRRLSLLVLHDDAEREYAYGPAEGLPETKVGEFPQSLYDEAQKNGWIVIRMKHDWKRVFPFDP